MARLLVIDDAANGLVETFSHPPLADESWIVEPARWSTFGFERSQHSPAQVIVANAAPGEPRVLELFAWLKAHPGGTATLVALPRDADQAFLHRCFTAADDVVLSPIRADELHLRISRLLRADRAASAAVRDRLNSEQSLALMVGTDPKFVREVSRIPLAARSDCEVLVTGETGTGKELCARAIHHLSRRSSFPFVCADCGALPDQLFENEMFGHERGAFTDAHRSQRGLVAVAEGGTLFLDEIDSLSLAAQAKLLRLLQDRSYRPLGAERFGRANIRFLTATNKDLEREVEAGAFRRDLYFRINVLEIHMTPLRERPGDIPLLAEHFLDACCAELRCPPKLLATSALQLLCSWEWPGNVRELYNVLRRAVVFSDGPRILPAHLLPDRDLPPETERPGNFRSARALAVQSFERRYVEDMLRRHAGNITRAAAEAGKDRRVFGRLVKRLKIDRTAVSAPPAGPRAGPSDPTPSS